MSNRIRLDVSSISVASFEPGPERRKGHAEEYMATRHTFDPCCKETVCVTLIECSSNRCN